MKSCLQLLLLFYWNFSFNIASEDDNSKTSETNFDQGFGEWQVANHSWVIDKWEDIKKKSNQSFQDPTTSNKSVSKVNPSILIHPSFQSQVLLTFKSTYTYLYNIHTYLFCHDCSGELTYYHRTTFSSNTPPTPLLSQYTLRQNLYF